MPAKNLVFAVLQWFNVSSCCRDVEVYSVTLSLVGVVTGTTVAQLVTWRRAKSWKLCLIVFLVFMLERQQLEQKFSISLFCTQYFPTGFGKRSFAY